MKVRDLMVPVRLQLYNFLSYGEPPQEIDLRGTHMVALVGNNGAGKSALLDAMTWALLGEARTNRNEQLIRQGANEMSVVFEFEVDGQLYRVRRHFSRKTKTHTATLEQLVSDRKWRPIVTENKVSAVNREIRRLLKMDYETFINTVFMPQGRSGEFMSLSPAERRDLLAQLLGLEVYEKLAEKAREQVKMLSGRISESEKRLADIESELAQKPFFVEEFERKRREREHMEQMLRQIDDEIRELQEKRERLLHLKSHLEHLRNEEQTVQRQINGYLEDLGELEKQLDQERQVLAKELQIVEALKMFQKVQAQEKMLSDKARQLKDLERQREELEKAISKVEAEIRVKLSARESDKANTLQRLEELQKVVSRYSEVKERLEELNVAREELKEWERKQTEWQKLQQERAQLEQSIAVERTAFAQKEGELQQAQSQLETIVVLKPEIERQLEELERDREKLNELQRWFDSARRKKEQLSGQLNICNTRREQLQKAKGEIREKLHLLEEHAGEPKCPLCETVLTPQKVASLKRKLIKEQERLESEISEAEREIAHLTEALHKLDNFLSQVERELEGLSEIERRLGEVNRRLAEIAEAERELEKVKNARELLKRELKEAEGRWHSLRAELGEREKAIGYDPVTHQQLRQKVETLAKFEVEIEQIKQAEKEVLLQRERLKGLEGEIGELKRKLLTGDFAHSERLQLGKVREEIRNLGYDENQHQKLKEWLEKNQHILQWWQRLQIAKDLSSKLERQIEQLKERIEENKKRLTEIDSEKRKLQQQLAQLTEVEERLNELQGRRKARENELQRLNEELGALRQKLEELGQKENEKQLLEQRLARMREEKADHMLLAEAFGRNGIPKSILRCAIPWLEGEACRILARLTQGRMRLRFALETQTQSGGQKEDLKIFISDELGDRPYELYSGGEKFRIDFAVRIALARLLAHRAGAPLRTLIIDEGFGSQDKEGLEAIIGAIQAVSREFDQILVVTHLDEFRDYFPTLIEVTKGSNGSQCRLIVRDQHESAGPQV